MNVTDITICFSNSDSTLSGTKVPDGKKKKKMVRPLQSNSPQVVLRSVKSRAASQSQQQPHR